MRNKQPTELYPSGEINPQLTRIFKAIPHTRIVRYCLSFFFEIHISALRLHRKKPRAVKTTIVIVRNKALVMTVFHSSFMYPRIFFYVSIINNIRPNRSRYAAGRQSEEGAFGVCFSMISFGFLSSPAARSLSCIFRHAPYPSLGYYPSGPDRCCA